MSHRIAIVGTGPAGFYAADGLLRGDSTVKIDLIDRLPTPFGLVRAGVAPDHQGTKAVARQFDRLLGQPNVRFCGGIEVGRDLSWEALCATYDAVVVATGMVIDRKLGVPDEDLPHVWGSWRFVAWLNGHPDFRKGPDLNGVKRVAVIGNGNVAIDVARVLAKSADEMAKSDIAADAGAAIAAAPLVEIEVIGRRGPEHASFTNNELAEMGRLARAVTVTEAAPLDVAVPATDITPEKLRKTKNLETLKGFAGNTPGGKPITVRFRFNTPAEAVRLDDYDLVVTCIGYRGADFPKAEGVFPVGWAKRGPSGTIPTNRADSHAVAQQVLAWLKGRAPKEFADPLPPAIDAAGWQRIDKAEIAAGTGVGRPRVKLTDWQSLLKVAKG